jgi:hypothetical protein
MGKMPLLRACAREGCSLPRIAAQAHFMPNRLGRIKSFTFPKNDNLFPNYATVSVRNIMRFILQACPFITLVQLPFILGAGIKFEHL